MLDQNYTNIVAHRRGKSKKRAKRIFIVEKKIFGAARRTNGFYSSNNYSSNENDDTSYGRSKSHFFPFSFFLFGSSIIVVEGQNKHYPEAATFYVTVKKYQSSSKREHSTGPPIHTLLPDRSSIFRLESRRRPYLYLLYITEVRYVQCQGQNVSRLCIFFDILKAPFV